MRLRRATSASQRWAQTLAICSMRSKARKRATSQSYVITWARSAAWKSRTRCVKTTCKKKVAWKSSRVIWKESLRTEIVRKIYEISSNTCRSINNVSKSFKIEILAIQEVLRNSKLLARCLTQKRSAHSSHHHGSNYRTMKPKSRWAIRHLRSIALHLIRCCAEKHHPWPNSSAQIVQIARLFCPKINF